MRILSIIAFFVLCSCKTAASPEEVHNSGKNEIENKASQSELPKGLISFIKAELPDFSFVETSDYIAEINEFIAQKSQPYFCQSDFDGNGENDYAVLLRKDISTICIIVFKSASNSYDYQLLECFEKSKSNLDIVLSIEPKGEWSSIDETLDVPNDGILVEFLKESHNYSYYWKNNSFSKYYYD